MSIEIDKLSENKELKVLLILQSFLPLFFLVFIRCFNCNRFNLVCSFLKELFSGNLNVICVAVKHSEFCSIVLLCICFIMFCVGIFVWLTFNQVQTSGYVENDEKIVIDEDITGNSVSFFVTYIIPLVMDDVDTWQKLLSFIAVVILLFLLMKNTNLYYQNPILTILGYKSFQFHFEINKTEKFIAITSGTLKIVGVHKFKRISDDVYLVYDKNQGGGQDSY